MKKYNIEKCNIKKYNIKKCNIELKIFYNE